jgi:hypothetical protein
MRSTLTLLAALPLTGCNLFRSAYIETTCEDLPGQCGTVDTEPGPDDTFDTAPWIPPPPSSLGVVLGSLVDGQIWLRALLPDGVIAKEAHFDASDLRTGPVEYDPVEDRLFLWDDAAATLWMIGGEGDVRSVGDVDAAIGRVHDLQMFEGALYLVSDKAIWRWTPDADALERLATTSSFYLLCGIFPSSQAGSLSVVDLGADDAPDLYRVDPSSAASVLVYADFDSEPGRTASGFQGPSSKPHVCSSVGAIYSVEDLQSGNRAPLVLADQDAMTAEFGVGLAEETTDCAWDAGAERFLIHSLTVGVLALDAWGHFVVLARPGEAEEFIRASFFVPLETE